MITKLIAIWNIVKSEHYFLLTANGHMTSVRPTDKYLDACRWIKEKSDSLELLNKPIQEN